MFIVAAAVAAKKAEGGDDSDTPIEENLNRLIIEGEARNVDEAIAVLRYGIVLSSIHLFYIIYDNDGDNDDYDIVIIIVNHNNDND